jgi:hypothetical protein
VAEQPPCKRQVGGSNPFSGSCQWHRRGRERESEDPAVDVVLLPLILSTGTVMRSACLLAGSPHPKRSRAKPEQCRGGYSCHTDGSSDQPRRIAHQRLSQWIPHYVAGRTSGLLKSRHPLLLYVSARGEWPSGVHGGVPERPKGAGCKPAGLAYGGSNPPAPTNRICSCSSAGRALPW